MQRSDYTVSTPAFVIDAPNFGVDEGHTINWDEVPGSYQNSDGIKVIPAGTVMSRHTGGGIVPRADAETGQDAIGILIAQADTDPHTGNSLSGVGLFRRGIFYETYLPDADDGSLPADYKTELGDAFQFEPFEDTRIS